MGIAVFTYLGEKVVKENEYLSAMVVVGSSFGRNAVSRAGSNENGWASIWRSVRKEKLSCCTR